MWHVLEGLLPEGDFLLSPQASGWLTEGSALCEAALMKSRGFLHVLCDGLSHSAEQDGTAPDDFFEN